MHSAVLAVHKSWLSLVTFFKTETSARATELKEFISTYTFVAFTSLLSDVLCVITSLSKKFQTESMDISAVNAHVNVALASLSGMKVDANAYLDDFFKSTTPDSSSFKGETLSNSTEADKQQFLFLRDLYLDSMTTHLEERLVNNSTEVLNAFSLLEPSMAVSLSVAERNKLFSVLESYFQNSAPVSVGSLEGNVVHPLVFVDTPTLKKELAKLTPLMSRCYSGLRFDGFARMLLIRHSDDFSQVCRLAEIGLCLPVSTVSCERGFSLQNRIKIKSRTRLLPENLERLMTIAGGPDLDSLPVADAVTHWYSERRRRLAHLYKQAKPQAQTESAVTCQLSLGYTDFQECEEELAGVCDAAYDVDTINK
jgi:hypothetical protein